MHVVYLTRPPFLDSSLNRARALAQLVDLTFVIELWPQWWHSSCFDAPRRRLRPGLTSGDWLLEEAMPERVARYLEDARGVYLAAFNQWRSFDMRTVITGQAVAAGLRRLRPDVLHMEESSVRIGWGLWSLRDLPTVMTIHDSRPHTGEGGWREELSRILSFPQVDRFILQNRSGVTEFASRYRVPSERIDLSHMAPYEVLQEWSGGCQIQRDQRLVLCLGRMSYYKGLDVLDDAARLVAERVPDVRVLVAGAPEPGFRAPQAHRLANNGRFDVIPRHVDAREAARLFEAAEVVVLPYREATQSGVVLSAFAFGTPVIASRVGGIPEYVRDGIDGLLVSPGDPGELADAIFRCLTDQAIAATLANGAAATAQASAGWNRVAREHLTTYERAVASHGRRRRRFPARRINGG